MNEDIKSIRKKYRQKGSGDVERDQLSRRTRSELARLIRNFYAQSHPDKEDTSEVDTSKMTKEQMVEAVLSQTRGKGLGGMVVDGRVLNSQDAMAYLQQFVDKLFKARPNATDAQVIQRVKEKFGVTIQLMENAQVMVP